MFCLPQRGGCTLLIALVLVCNGASAAESRSPERIRVITYNVQFLPDPVSHLNERPEPEYRATRIAEEVSRYDLIALQELFHVRHKTLLLNRLQSLWSSDLQMVSSPLPPGFWTTGGCVLVSKQPIITQHTTVFTHFSKPEDYGTRADGYAAKGVLHARVRRAGRQKDNFVDVFVTHLEARADDLRPLQYAEVAAFIKQHSDTDHPALLMGDLNTRGSQEFREDPHSQYSQLMQALANSRAGKQWTDLWAHLHSNALGGTTRQQASDIGKRIDYVLLSNPDPPHPQLAPISVDVHLFQDDKVTALSDHNAVSAVLEWQ